jgi:hypothetical protein
VRFAKTLAVVMVLLFCAAPILAANKPHTGECRKLTKQIARYERDVRWADHRGNERWEDASQGRVNHLATRRAGLCPQYRRQNPLAKMYDFLATAAKAAAPYFIPGL